MLEEERIFDLLKDCKELSSLPQVLAEVIRVTDKEDSSATDIAKVILKDPTLSARILRVVNSPFYGAIHGISTINQAVVTLGVRAVKALALSSSLYNLFNHNHQVVDRIQFWRHSLEVAIASREIARSCSYNPSEEAFVAGLMHDLGMLILESNFPDKFQRIWKYVESGESQVRQEESTWGTNHARVAKFLLDQWRLPAFLGEAIALHHHEFSEDDNLPQNRLARIINLANRLSKFRLCQVPPLDTYQLLQIEKLAASLEIGSTALAEIQEQTLSQLVEESEFLEIKIGSLTDLLSAANALIYKQYLFVESVLRENRKMQAQIARDQLKKAALDSLKTITATLSHYINNASATILGRAQLVELAIKKNKIRDSENIGINSMDIIVKSVETISMVLEELKKLSSFDTTHYHDETDILDIEDRLTKKIATIEGRKNAAAPMK